MINNQSDIVELINELETQPGRVHAIVDLSKQYQLPEEMMKEAIAFFESEFDNEPVPDEYKKNPDWHRKNPKPLETAATLARKILWMDKAVDLVAKARKPENAADMAKEFGLDERALELYKEAGKTYLAIEMAKKLENWDEYIALCQKDGAHLKAVQKCQELGRDEEAKEIVRTKIEEAIKSSYQSREEKFIKLIKETGMFDLVEEICREQDLPKTLAGIAAQTGHHAVAFELFKETGQYVDAAKQALQLSNESAQYRSEAQELYLKGIEEGCCSGRLSRKEILELLKECLSKTGISEGIEDRIFEYHVKLKLFDEGIEYFRGREDKTRTLKMLEASDQFVKARNYALEHKMTDKVRELDYKLGRKPSLEEKVEQEETFENAIAHYTSAIKEDGANGNYYSAARISHEAAAFCRAQGNTESAEEFDEQVKYFKILNARVEAKEAEEQGYWEGAANYAKAA
ncbi:hypothetical protein KY315_03545, partial [Candidatus Woesearchaeota archaeon]|nr:hypothetical protein [Candidatus Woesearchaeota archaeon]